MGGPHSANRCGIIPGTSQAYQEGNYGEPYDHKKGRSQVKNQKPLGTEIPRHQEFPLGQRKHMALGE